ncbi:MAG: glycosyltransferase family 9 protein [Chthoniobacterales bacterium]
MTTPGKILFFKFGAMGDVLMTTPLLRQTRRVFPQAQIEFWVARGFDAVLVNNPYLDKIQTFDPAIFTEKKWTGLLALTKGMRGFDLVFVLDKHWSFAVTAFLAGIPRRVGFWRDGICRVLLTQGVPYGPIRHEIHYYLDLLETLTPVDRLDVSMDFSPTPVEPDPSQALPSDYVACINSGGNNLRESSAIRMLPARLFIQLVDILRGKGPVVLLGDAGDHAWYRSLDLPSDIINLAGKLNLAGSVQVMRNARHIYVTDSGAMHLAGTTATPMTVFFGPTHPQRKAPLRSGVSAIWADESDYDNDYEVYGRLPRRSDYFQTTSLESVDAATSLAAVPRSDQL